ncbi:MAG: efflux RND transporter periplasmic adaptor subunit, partial [Janthinobacterium lividum]
MTGHARTIDPRLADPGEPLVARRRGRAGPVIAVAALLLAGGGGVWALRQGQATPAALPAAPPPPVVTVAAPLARSVARTLDFTGQFSAVDEVELRAQVSGYLSEIHFADGQMVRKGDLLFVVDPRPYEIALQQAGAQFQAANAALDLANRQVGRSTELVRESFASREVLDQRVQAQLSAQAGVEQAKAAIHAAQLNLDFTRITAPFAGRMGMRRVSIGSLVSGGPGAASGTALTTLVSLDPVHLDFDMSEADYLAYSRFVAAGAGGPDRTVQAALGDEAGWPRHGTLDFLDNAVERSSGTLHARATLANPGLLIAPGQFARLRVPVSAPRPVLLVPDA